jgi:ABC-type uncharacterized transport system auxiliary subunit
MRRILVPAAALLCLGGCVTLLPEPGPPPRTFLLNAGEAARLDGPPIDAAVVVAEPGGEPAVLGTSMVWSTGDEIAYVAHTQWSARADDALRAILVETLSRQGRFRAAARSGELSAAFEIRWDVLRFQIDNASMTARFAADVRVTQAPGRQIIAQRIVSAEAPVADRSQTAAAQALARAAREGAARIGAFAAEEAAQVRER